MKITKKSNAVKASEIIPGIVDEPVAACPEVVAVVTECKYQSAIDLISGAIESLAQIANDDQIAKDSIANLGVVLFDLKGACCQ